jgi:hypothetical protein
MRIEIDYPVDGDDPRPQKEIEREIECRVKESIYSGWLTHLGIEVVVTSRYLMVNPEIRLANVYILLYRGELDVLMDILCEVVGMSLLRYNSRLRVRAVIAKHLRSECSFG